MYRQKEGLKWSVFKACVCVCVCVHERISCVLMYVHASECMSEDVEVEGW